MSVEVLLAGSLGALTLFVLDRVVDWVVDRRRRGNELAGLLRLVDMEVGHNIYTILPAINEHYPENLTRPQMERPLTTDVWEQTRVRIAQLLSDKEKVKDLVEYHKNLQEMNDLLGPYTSPIKRKNFMPDAQNKLANQGIRIRRWIGERYLDKDARATCSWWRWWFGFE
jgi:hypothetical protein